MPESCPLRSILDLHCDEGAHENYANLDCLSVAVCLARIAKSALFMSVAQKEKPRAIGTDLVLGLGGNGNTFPTYHPN